MMVLFLFSCLLVLHVDLWNWSGLEPTEKGNLGVPPRTGGSWPRAASERGTDPTAVESSRWRTSSYASTHTNVHLRTGHHQNLRTRTAGPADAKAAISTTDHGRYPSFRPAEVEIMDAGISVHCIPDGPTSWMRDYPPPALKVLTNIEVP